MISKPCLYLLNKPTNLELALSQINSDDALVLFEDAVILATRTGSEQLSKLVESQQVYVLAEDILARGLQAQNAFISIDYPKLVELSLKFEKSVSVL